MKEIQRQKLFDLFGDKVRLDCPLSRYTSFVIGGPAAALVEVDDTDELQQLLIFCHNEKVEWRVIGGGTNLLVRDGGYDGIVIHLGKGFKKVNSWLADKAGRVVVEADAGFGLSRLADWCADCGFSGLEFASGIPGSLGGAVIMNAGAWGAEVGDVLTAVELVGRSGSQVIERDQLHFGYRSWHDYRGERTKQVVTKAVFELQLNSVEKIKERCRGIREKRRHSQPHGGATCGSFFKNPQNDSAGRLIEACGLKGTRIGGAMVSTKHANFFINTGDATAKDMIQLMEMVRKKVEESHGVLLEPEVHFL